MAQAFIRGVNTWVQSALSSSAVNVGIPVAAGIVANEILEQQPQVVVVTNPPPIVITASPIPSSSLESTTLLVVLIVILLVVAIVLGHNLRCKLRRREYEIEMASLRTPFRRAPRQSPPSPVV